MEKMEKPEMPDAAGKGDKPTGGPLADDAVADAVNAGMVALGDEPSVIRELFAYGLARKAQIGAENVYDFSLGNPSVPAPACVGESLARLAASDPVGLHGYTPAPGLPAVRARIAESLNARFGCACSADNLYLTCGAAASISISLRAILREGDEVIAIAPYFPEYRVWTCAHGGSLVEVPARTEDFQPDLEAIARAISPRTRALIVNSPNNPVGVVYRPEVLSALCDLLREASERIGHPIFLVSDEPYRELVYGEARPVWMPSLYEHVLVCYSWSKSLSLPGERIGYILVPETMPDAKRVYAAICGAGRALGFVCAPALFQRMIAECIDAPVDSEPYRANRDALTSMLDELGYEYIVPEGAFYLWIKSMEPDAKAFSDAAKEHELLIVPSDSFGVPGWVRVSYCVSDQVIRASRDAFAALAARYR